MQWLVRHRLKMYKYFLELSTDRHEAYMHISSDMWYLSKERRKQDRSVYNSQFQRKGRFQEYEFVRRFIS
jgi:hypothetical protein